MHNTHKHPHLSQSTHTHTHSHTQTYTKSTQYIHTDMQCPPWLDLATVDITDLMEGIQGIGNTV